jgi:hypothetical protein
MLDFDFFPGGQQLFIKAGTRQRPISLMKEFLIMKMPSMRRAFCFADVVSKSATTLFQVVAESSLNVCDRRADPAACDCFRFPIPPSHA